MPIPTRRKGEKEDAFVSRCISQLSKIDKNRTREQITAICYRQARASLTDNEIEALQALIDAENKNYPPPQQGDEVKNLKPKKKKKKKQDRKRKSEDDSGYYG